jgi:hypothetical protein
MNHQRWAMWREYTGARPACQPEFGLPDTPGLRASSRETTGFHVRPSVSVPVQHRDARHASVVFDRPGRAGELARGCARNGTLPVPRVLGVLARRRPVPPSRANMATCSCSLGTSLRPTDQVEGRRCGPPVGRGARAWPIRVDAPVSFRLPNRNDEPTSFRSVGNSSDSRGLAQCRDTVYCNA